MYQGEYEYVTEQIELHGEVYVNDLVERGFIPVHTNTGWRWMLKRRARLTPREAGLAVQERCLSR